MTIHRGFEYNGPGTLKPWHPIENQLDKDIIDTIVMGCVSEEKATGGHKHYRLHDTTGNVAVTIDSAGNAAVGLVSALAKTHIQSTTGAQLRLSYDSTHYADMTVDNVGTLSLTTTGTRTISTGATYMQKHDISMAPFHLSRSFIWGTNEANYMARSYYAAEGVEAAIGVFDADDYRVLYSDQWHVYWAGGTNKYENVANMEVRTVDGGCSDIIGEFSWGLGSTALDDGALYPDRMKLTYRTLAPTEFWLELFGSEAESYGLHTGVLFVGNDDCTDYATILGNATGGLTITTVDAAAAAGHIALMPDGYVGINRINPDSTLHVDGTITQKANISCAAFTLSNCYAWGTDEANYMERHYYIAEGTEASPDPLDTADFQVLYGDYWHTYWTGNSDKYMQLANMEVRTKELSGCSGDLQGEISWGLGSTSGDDGIFYPDRMKLTRQENSPAGFWLKLYGADTGYRTGILFTGNTDCTKYSTLYGDINGGLWITSANAAEATAHIVFWPTGGVGINIGAPASALEIASGGGRVDGYITMHELGADAAAPAATACALYVKDNGAGKTGLYARFETGAVVLIALEP